MQIKRKSIQMFCTTDMVPQDHLLRIADKAINWNLIYGCVVDTHIPDHGRTSMDQVMLIKLPSIQYLYDIKSMWKNVKKSEANIAYRWFFVLK
ncbi:hypothetical protein GPL26_16990 [Enterocloster citroniae]|uniref:Transposase InsH N-terminal domain-containing protein n=1 Tax=Enterocloster citroniae TaxID=358743 RepID=A0AA41FGS8_9FIRM|nr:hypothetical protein [Enterocloster citroniae]